MNSPDRGSSKSGPELGEVRKKEVEGQIRPGHPTRAGDTQRRHRMMSIGHDPLKPS
ncbi:hypothetical protein ABZX75_31765 [Streptomyces sp. NPDC003038]|uniref:hypothetical protein n=1 Tax=unclassified Streptomyces TaxID=2593676 RepID=UPI0033BBCDC9